MVSTQASLFFCSCWFQLVQDLLFALCLGGKLAFGAVFLGLGERVHITAHVFHGLLFHLLCLSGLIGLRFLAILLGGLGACPLLLVDL